MRVRFLLFGLFSFVSNLVFSQQIISDSIENEILRRTKLEINPSISIGILLPSGEAKFYNYGQIDTSGETATNLSLYEIGSVTKTFTARLAEIYLEDELDMSIADFFPEIENEDLMLVKVNELRNHKSGLPRLSNQFSPKDWSDPFNGYSNALLETELRNLKIDTSKTWSYSNFGFGVLGRIIEKKTVSDFPDLVGELFQDSEMYHSHLEHATVNKKLLVQPTNIGTKNKNWKFTGPSRYAGGLISCTQDLVSYLKFQKENNDQFQVPKIENLHATGIDDLGANNLFYKNGWFVLKPENSTEILLHNGGTGGYTSFVAYNKNTKTGVVALSNSVSLVDDIGLKIIYPEFKLNHPNRTIAYDLADAIERKETKDLVGQYYKLKNEKNPSNILDIYWLERLNFGNKNWKISAELSEIMTRELPEDWEVWDIKGQNLEKLKEYKNAEIAYQKAYELNPEKETLLKSIERCRKLRQE